MGAACTRGTHDAGARDVRFPSGGTGGQRSQNPRLATAPGDSRLPEHPKRSRLAATDKLQKDRRCGCSR